eukprot:657204-Prorocentrum_minimum.AAC.1
MSRYRRKKKVLVYLLNFRGGDSAERLEQRRGFEDLCGGGSKDVYEGHRLVLDHAHAPVCLQRVEGHHCLHANAARGDGHNRHLRTPPKSRSLVTQY